MVERIGVPAMLEQLAEEAAELAHAALKCARIHRGDNPTPVELPEAVRMLEEEYTDVVQCAVELNLTPDKPQMVRKENRFRARWEEGHGKEKA